MRTRNARSETFVTLASEVYVGVAVGELVRGLDVGEVMQHSLLHRELSAKTIVYVYAIMVRGRHADLRAL